MTNSWFFWAFLLFVYALSIHIYQVFLPDIYCKITAMNTESLFMFGCVVSILVVAALACIYKFLGNKF